MKICDRTWRRDGQPVIAPIMVAIEGAEIDEVYHLSATEAEALRSFLNEPRAWRRDDSIIDAAAKVLRLKGK